MAYLERAIFVDVDHTLCEGWRINPRVLAWCWDKKEEGNTLYLWSARGKEYCDKTVERHGLGRLFSATLHKPEIIVDDLVGRWCEDVALVDPANL